MLTAGANSVGIEGVPDSSTAAEKLFKEGRDRAIPAAGSVRLPLTARATDALRARLFVVEYFYGFFDFFRGERALEEPEDDGGSDEFLPLRYFHFERILHHTRNIMNHR